VYTLIRQAGLRKGLGGELPSLVCSVTVAELFYRFHSFTLECLCFLATWLALSFLFSLPAAVLRPGKREVGGSRVALVK
jgi:hypothetical protein